MYRDHREGTRDAGWEIVLMYLAVLPCLDLKWPLYARYFPVHWVHRYRNCAWIPNWLWSSEMHWTSLLSSVISISDDSFDQYSEFPSLIASCYTFLRYKVIVYFNFLHKLTLHALHTRDFAAAIPIACSSEPCLSLHDHRPADADWYLREILGTKSFPQKFPDGIELVLPVVLAQPLLHVDLWIGCFR